ncbi:MAG: ammonium transporter [Gemmatimonadota bacterium]
MRRASPPARAAWTGLALLALPALAGAQEPDLPTQVAALATHLDWYWTCVAAFLVFFMQAGFALVEAGFTRAKNVVNILMKNLMDFAIGSIAFWAVGFGLMFGAARGICGWGEFFVNPDAQAYGEEANWMYAFLIFQTVFAATAATIVSGAMAERTKFSSYLIYSLVISAFVYPVSGSWAWGGLWHGGGWLEKMGFVDFAGSTVVHSVGGWAALSGAIVLGARRGKYNPDGSANAIVGHSMPLAALGVFILWLGWFGFNPGSTTSMDGGSFARVAVVTNLSAAAGSLAAMFASWIRFGKPDISMSLNGALAGLVAITAGCYTMTPLGGILTGLIAGALVFYSVLFVDRLRIDDPVGAVSVHGVCGAWGTLACAVPFFCRPGEAASFTTQLIGVAAIFAFAFGTTFVLFNVLKATVGLRVSPAEEDEGLDIIEHGMTGYPDFQTPQH